MEGRERVEIELKIWNRGIEKGKWICKQAIKEAQQWGKNKRQKDRLKNNQFKDIFLLKIVTNESSVSLPAKFMATQVYRPLSWDTTPRNVRLPFWSMIFFSPGITALPSLSHVIRGLGIPLAIHVILMVLPLNAVMLSPIVMTTGPIRFDSMFWLLIGFCISGSEKAEKEKDSNLFICKCSLGGDRDVEGNWSLNVWHVNSS